MPSRTLITASVAGAAAIALLATGCGGGSATTPASTATRARPLAFSQCMHSHGVPSFPDPDAAGVIPKEEIRPLAGSPNFQAAESACQYLLPGGSHGSRDTAQQIRTRVADALAFARCMRARGFQAFPDPTTQGELSPEMVTAAGIDLHQPALLRAGLACVPVTHGLLTPAAIERAVHGG